MNDYLAGLDPANAGLTLNHQRHIVMEQLKYVWLKYDRAVLIPAEVQELEAALRERAQKLGLTPNRSNAND